MTTKIEKYAKVLDNNNVKDVILRCDENGVISIDWKDATPIDMATLDAEVAALPSDEEEAANLANLKASAKQKLVAGEPLTEQEADTLVL